MASWKPQWSIANPGIDAQHREILDRFDAFVEAASTGSRTAAATEALFFLSGYVEKHFGDEERLMEEVGYPALEDHREMHRSFVKELASLSERFLAKGATPSFLLALANLFESWLTFHIIKVDLLLGRYLAEHSR